MHAHRHVIALMAATLLIGLASSHAQEPVEETALDEEVLEPLSIWTLDHCDPANPMFLDVPCPGGQYVDWVEQLARDAIHTPCGVPTPSGGSYFCPDRYVTRRHLAVFLERAMRGTEGWTPGDVTAVRTGSGSGLQGGGEAGDVELSIAAEGVTEGMLAPGSVSAGKLLAPAGSQGQVLSLGSGGAMAWQTGLATPGTAVGNTPYWDGSQWVASSFNLFNNGASIGIGGVSLPRAQLEVGGTNGILSTGTFGAGDVLTLGGGTRLHWYPRKAAFRAGTAEGSRWDDANIGDHSIAMGYYSRATSPYAVAIGRQVYATGERSLAMGAWTQATATDAVAIGYDSWATGPYSLALGSEVSTNGYTGAVVIGDATPFARAYAGCDNQLTLRFAGGENCSTYPCDGAAYRFWTSYSDCMYGVYMMRNSSGWSSYSSRSFKENFRILDGEELLGKIRGMLIAEWNYKNGDASIKYMGPVAEEFHAAFGLNSNDPGGINTISIDGVNMAGVQALELRTARQREQIEAQQATIQALEARLARLERLLAERTGP